MNLTDAQERDLFQRVQKGIQLTKAEQFRATRGEWQSFAEMYERDFPKVVNRMSQLACLCVHALLIISSDCQLSSVRVPQYLDLLFADI